MKDWFGTERIVGQVDTVSSIQVSVSYQHPLLSLFDPHARLCPVIRAEDEQAGSVS